MSGVSFYPPSRGSTGSTHAVRDDFYTVAKRGLHVGACGLAAASVAWMIMKVVQKNFQHTCILIDHHLPLLKGTLKAYSIAFIVSEGASYISKYFRHHEDCTTFCEVVRVVTVLLITSILTYKLPFPFAGALRSPTAVYYGIVAAARLLYVDQGRSLVERVAGRDSLACYYFCAFLLIQISGLRARLPLGVAVAMGVVPAMLWSDKISLAMMRGREPGDIRIITTFVMSLLCINCILWFASFSFSPHSPLRVGFLGALGYSTVGAFCAAITMWYLSERQLSSRRNSIGRRVREWRLSLTYAVGYSLIVGAVTIASLAFFGKLFAVVNNIPEIKGHFVVAALGGMLTIFLSKFAFLITTADDSSNWSFIIKNLITLVIISMIAPKMSSLFSDYRVSSRRAAIISVMGTLCQFFLSRFS